MDALRCSAMRVLVPLLLSIGALGCAKKTTGDWSAARSHYCDEVDLLQHEVDDALGMWTKRFEELPAKTPAEQVEACTDARTNLDKLAATLMGFQRGAGALAHGRGDLSLDQAGLVLDFGGTTLMQSLTDLRCREGAPFAAYAQALAKVKPEVMKRLDAGVAACTTTGWKSALAK